MVDIAKSLETDGIHELSIDEIEMVSGGVGCFDQGDGIRNYTPFVGTDFPENHFAYGTFTRWCIP